MSTPHPTNGTAVDLSPERIARLCNVTYDECMQMQTTYTERAAYWAMHVHSAHDTPVTFVEQARTMLAMVDHLAVIGRPFNPDRAPLAIVRNVEQAGAIVEAQGAE
jgi:hypothetical protein